MIGQYSEHFKNKPMGNITELSKQLYKIYFWAVQHQCIY